MKTSNVPEADVLTRADKRSRLLELAGLFLKLGAIGFGGPAAHIALMESEVVRRRGWLRHEEFLDLLGATNLIPGPNSTEMAIHVGHKRAGFAGLVVAGTCFILPAMLIVGACAWAYVNFGKLPQVQGVLYGVKPVIIAVVLQALWGLSRSAVKTRALAVIGIAVAGLTFLGWNELLLLVIAGMLANVARVMAKDKGSSPNAGAGVPDLMLPQGALAVGTAGAAAAKVFGIWPMFWFFLKVGSVLYGSGYVLLAFLRADLVEKWGWLTETQLLDAIAVGQVTPGPVFTTATFIGYVLGGPVAAVVATVGIFLPAFFFVAVSGPLIPRLRRSPVAGAFLDGVNVGSLALMTVVTWELGRSAIVGPVTIGLALASAVLLIRYKINSVWLILGGAIVGLVVRRGF